MMNPRSAWLRAIWLATTKLLLPPFAFAGCSRRHLRCSSDLRLDDPLGAAYTKSSGSRDVCLILLREESTIKLPEGKLICRQLSQGSSRQIGTYFFRRFNGAERGAGRRNRRYGRPGAWSEN